MTLNKSVYMHTEPQAIGITIIQILISGVKWNECNWYERL